MSPQLTRQPACKRVRNLFLFGPAEAPAAEG
jgi:hypothetical protein